MRAQARTGRAAAGPALLLAAILIGGCGDGESSSTTAVSVAPSSSASPTIAPPTVAPATTASPTTPTSTPAATEPATSAVETTIPETAPPTTAACETFTDIDVKSDGFPGRLSTLVGADVRTGRHPCFERFVLELQGTGDFPGYRVLYEDRPLTDDPRGEPVEVAGSAFIVVVVESWMTTMEGDGYQGPTRITPTNVTHIEELVMLGNFESVTTWAIGVDEQRPFEVSVLDGPPRLVVDIGTS